MGFTCCVPNCKNTSKNFKMHRLPHVKKELYNIWIKRIGNTNLFNIDPVKVNKNYRVCDIHFSDFCRVDSSHKTNRTGLIATSLPTMHLAGFDETSTPENSIFQYKTLGKIQGIKYAFIYHMCQM